MRHDIKIIMGDVNTQIGGNRSGFENAVGPHAYARQTENGDHFIQICSVNNLMIASSMFVHKDRHKIT